MSSLVKLLGTFAPGHPLEHGGKTYVFGRIDQAMKAALTVAYFKRARDAVYAIKGEVAPDEYDRQLKAALDSYRRGEYAFAPGGEAFGYFTSTGLDELTATLTGCTPGEAFALVKEKTVEVLHLCLCLVYECLNGEDKKKLLSQEGTPAMRQLVATLSPRTTPDGSPSSTPTPPPD